MNTRQKLTLGIAAIFMVTLTIVGVTYAYFLTRVEGEEQLENINVGTIEVEDITYVEGDPEIVMLANSVPGEYAQKTFSVKNPNDTAGTYDLFITNGVPTGATEFLHSNVTAEGYEVKACYAKNALDTYNANKTGILSNCFKGDTYDNIVVTLLKDGSAVSGIDKVKVKYDSSNNGAVKQKLGTLSINANTTDSYVLRVDYLDANVEGSDNVQNLEFSAALNIKVDITDPNTIR